MKKTLTLVVAAAMGLSGVAFAADAATAAPVNNPHVRHHHVVKAKKAAEQKAQAAKKTHKHAKQQKKAAH